MKMYEGMEVLLCAFLISALDGGEWSASHAFRFAPGERVPGDHVIGSRVGPRPCLDRVAKIKKCPSRGPLGCDAV
jgi:hypothetical protein